MIWFNRKEPKESVTRRGDLPTAEQIEASLKRFILSRTKLVQSNDLHADTALFSSGLLDSLSFVQLIATIEKEYRVRFPRTIAMSIEKMDRINQIVPLVLGLSKTENNVS